MALTLAASSRSSVSEISSGFIGCVTCRARGHAHLLCLIAHLPYLQDPRWKGIPAYLHYAANYLLIVDNLSDFAHLAFVHTKTLGGSEEYAYKSKPTAIERLEDGFRVERWHMDADAPPFHKKVVRNAGRLDRRNIARMYVPGIFFMETLFSPAGDGAEKGNLANAKQ